MESAKLAFIVLAAVVVLLGVIVASVWKLKPECFHRLKFWICRHALKCKDDHKRDTTTKATEIETGNGKDNLGFQGNSSPVEGGKLPTLSPNQGEEVLFASQFITMASPTPKPLYRNPPPFFDPPLTEEIKAPFETSLPNSLLSSSKEVPVQNFEAILEPCEPTPPPEINRLANELSQISIIKRSPISKPSPKLKRNGSGRKSKLVIKQNAPPRHSPKSTRYPPHFIRKKRRGVALSQNAMKNHICSGRALDERMARLITEKRRTQWPKNTVFAAPSGWDEWDTMAGDRIVSSERVDTYQCERFGNLWDISYRGERFAIFTPNWPRRGTAHLEAHESLQT